MNLHLAGWTAEQNAGPILSDVIVGGRRLCVARANAEAHLWDQRTSAAAVAMKGGAIVVIQDEDLFMRLQGTGKNKDSYQTFLLGAKLSQKMAR